MVEHRVAARMFSLNDYEVYAGTTKSEWEVIVAQQNTLKPVKLDASELEASDLECDICRIPFGCADDDGILPEQPVALPCNHVFGQNCISSWIAIGRRPVPVQVPRFRAVGPDSFDDLLLHPPPEVPRTTAFSCPKCRKRHTIPVVEKQIAQEKAMAVKARLHFWDRAYDRLGIHRSPEEEASREDLQRFVEMTPTEFVSGDRMRSYDLRAQVSALRFAVRRAHSDLTPVQSQLRDALFNLACFGIDETPAEYHDEWYEDRPIPIWCWQFDKIQRGCDPSYDWSMGEFRDRFLADWAQQRLGPWRRTLMAEVEVIPWEYRPSEQLQRVDQWDDYDPVYRATIISNNDGSVELITAFI
ncbi:hypothetical protein MMC07_001339 [Pseudocyphellaria aurata]|nr:hypothetical protein [Pseudocyphellaria aurata]